MNCDSRGLSKVLPLAESLLSICNVAYDEQEKYGGTPTSDSPATHDVEKYVDAETPAAAYTLGAQALIVACGHVRALHRSLTLDPLLTHSAWLCARGALEACSKCIWLLDPSINSVERITRSLNIRLAEINEALKLCRQLPQRTATKERLIDKEVLRLNTSIKELRTQAKSVGVTETFNRKGQFSGFGIGLQSMSRQIMSTLGAYGANNSTYPLLSAAAHGVSWAASLLSSWNETDYPTRDFTDLVSKRVEWLIVMSTLWLSRGVWVYHYQFGWNLLKIEAVLETAYDRHGLHAKARFWR